MSYKEALSGQSVVWWQGTNSSGGFGQITPADYLIVSTPGFGDLTEMLGKKITLSLESGSNQGRTFETTVISIGPGSATVRVADQWPLLGIVRNVNFEGVARLSFPAPAPEPEPEPEPEEPPTGMPFGSLPSQDGINLAQFLAAATEPNRDAEKRVHCNSIWWLLLVAALVYLSSKRK